MRVLVLRPQKDAEQTAKRLNAHGYEAIIAPLLRVKPLEICSPDFASCNAIIATSANAFRCLPGTYLDKIKSIPCFTVGSQTTEAAQNYGLNQVTSASGDAAALVKLVKTNLLTSSHLMYITGQPRKSDLEISLLRHGFNVSIYETYKTEAVAHLPQKAVAAFKQGVDVILHFSRHSAEIAMTLFEEAGLMHELQTARHICISSDTANGLYGCAHMQIAKKPDQAAMLDLLES